MERRVIDEVSLSLSILLIMWNSLEYFLPKNLMFSCFLWVATWSSAFDFWFRSKESFYEFLHFYFWCHSEYFFMSFDNEPSAERSEMRCVCQRESKSFRCAISSDAKNSHYDKWWIIVHAISWATSLLHFHSCFFLEIEDSIHKQIRRHHLRCGCKRQKKLFIQ